MIPIMTIIAIIMATLVLIVRAMQRLATRPLVKFCAREGCSLYVVVCQLNAVIRAQKSAAENSDL